MLEKVKMEQEAQAAVVFSQGGRDDPPSCRPESSLKRQYRRPLNSLYCDVM